MSNNGWIKLHRQSLQSVVFSDPWLWQLFCWCLLKANHEAHPWKGQIIPRGSFATGRLSAAEQLQVSQSKFHRGIAKLVSLKLISKKSNNRFTVIRVEKYEEYQKREGESEHPADNQRTSGEHPADTNKNDKKEKKKRPPSFDPRKVVIPDELTGDSFATAWGEWCDHRAETKKKMTETSTDKQLKGLAAMGPARAIAAIDHSIASGWQGIFEPNGQDRGKQSTKSQYKNLG